MQPILDALGAGTNDLLAAFLGSVCGAFMLTKPTWRAIIATVFVGSIVGTYSSKLTEPNNPVHNFVTLVIGSFGTAALLLGQDFVRRRIFNGDKSK